MAHVFRCFLGWMGLLALLMGGARAQSTAGYGDWQLHLPTNHPLHLADAGDRVYVATEHAFYYLDKSLSTTRVLSTRDGLSDVGVIGVAYDSVTHQAVLAYGNTNVDILQDNGKVHNLSDILRKTIQGKKEINHVSISNGKAYLAASFGLVVVDLNKLEITDTYSNIGPGGVVVAVYDAVVSNGTVFAATSAGLLRGQLASNLLDYHSWTQDLPVPLSTTRPVYPYLATYAGQVYAAVEGSGSGVYRYEAGTPGQWRSVTGSYTSIFRGLRGTSTGVLIVDDLSGVRRIDRNNVVTTVIPGVNGEYTDDVVRSRDGSYYVAYYNGGLQRVQPGSGKANERFEANGPAGSQDFSLLADARSNTVDVFSGGFSERYLPFGSRGGFFEYANGQWTNITGNTLPPAEYPNLVDLTRGARTPDGTLYVSSFGEGLLEWKGPGTFRRFTSTATSAITTPIRPFAGPGNDRIGDVTAAADGSVWITNPHGLANTSGLFQFTPGPDTWLVVPYARNFENLDRLVLDDTGLVWATVARKPNNPSIPGQTEGGLLAIDPAPTATNPPRFLTVADGLPDNQIYELAKDRRGYIWAATIKGVAYFNAAEGPFTAGTAFTAPIVTRGEGTGFPALFTDAVRAIAVDGGDRKWFATDHGLWLFSPDADEALLHFTKANSPLPSDRVVDVKVNDKTGEVWIATDAGVVAYRGGASVTEGEPHCTAVFPNPVRPDFAGMVGISGLANNALVKITDIAGHLVYATKASGGTVTWNLTTPDGQRVRSGLYLVLSSDADGKNGCVSKVAVLSK